MILKNVLQKVSVLCNRAPHGLFSSSILFSKAGSIARLHRNALSSRRGKWPVAIWFVGQAWLALRWRLLFATVETERAVARYGPAVEEREQIPIALQRERVFKVARKFCISPIEAYWFRLYRDPAAALEYVYASETIGVHKLCNAHPNGDLEAVLGDKLLFAESAKELGLPVVPTLLCLSKADDADLAELARHSASSDQGLFIKARRGQRGLGAFLVHGGPTPDLLVGRMLDGRRISGVQQVQKALEAICLKDDALVQPLLTSHNSLAQAALELWSEVGDALRGGISWRCRVAVNSQPRKGYATCQTIPSPSCPIHRDLALTRSRPSFVTARAN